MSAPGDGSSAHGRSTEGVPLIVAVDHSTVHCVRTAVALLRDTAAPSRARPIRIVSCDDVGSGETLAGGAGLLEVRADRIGMLRAIDAPVGVAQDVWAGGRWRFEHRGEAADAGTPMELRADPLLTHAMTVLAANKQARTAGALATFTQVRTAPATSAAAGAALDAVPGEVTAWLDARAPSAARVTMLVDAIESQARSRAERDGTRVTVAEEERYDAAGLDAAWGARIAGSLAPLGRIPALILNGRYAAARWRSPGPAAILVVDSAAPVDRMCAALSCALAELLEPPP